ncbi:CinA family nicotinamide mononucleotide deamidase-related protein [Actinocorallia populi]|uniref:CinA family nicotinamide mononucleotide deamidase-related protein n=1 Tax=Actinocorallia populi TaxID=2079200 RepID=UPI000D09663F|nr:CinA family nicotinamide mononucleotide deamidase-related protein [Actinocorallia populi]
MRAELLTVGDEILIGDIVNGNAAWLGRELTAAGVEVGRSTVVGDTLEAITGALTAALAAADVVIVTGGLGPTSDDRTRDALAALAQVPLVRDETLAGLIRDRVERSGLRLRPMSLRMADVPEGATMLPNPAGTAPGLRMELPGGTVYALPGVPSEMQAIMAVSVLPELADGDAAPAVLTLRTAGVWETVLATRLAPVEALEEVSLAFLPSPSEVAVRLTADTSSALDKAVLMARELLGTVMYGTGEQSLASVVHELLAARERTVAVAESLTGGLLGAELTYVPGSSETFAGGVTAYETRLKHELLGVSASLLEERGAVDPQVAVQMAEGARERLGAFYGLGVTGVAGPGSQDGKPVGTVHIGISGPEGSRSFTPVLPLPPDLTQARANIRRMTVVQALDLLRHEILGVAMVRQWEEDQEDREGLT